MRKSGVLMHISSLPSPYGVGTMGKDAREFVDFLAEAGQSCWQLLPVCPTSYGDSPYQSYSTFAGNPYFIDLDLLEQEGFLEKSEYRSIDWENKPEQVNYGALYEKRYPILRLAAGRFLQAPSEKFKIFCRDQSFWLDDYALFMTLKNIHEGLPWTDWQPDCRNHDADALAGIGSRYKEDILFWKVLQFFFFEQWKGLRVYANAKKIDIIGDLPFYVAMDSVDVWAHPELFQLDEERKPMDVAGCPPDGFSATGQLWGNPLYRWEEHKESGYRWWIQRIGYLCNVYNVLRIDHFRGFDSYYAIPYGDPDASGGRWMKGPGMDFFRTMEETIGAQRIIAEDLGFLTESVRGLLRDSGFPGMKVLEFAFDTREASHEDYLPYNYPKHCVAYTGTHDNDTIQGWFKSAGREDIAFAKDYLRIRDEADGHWDMMCGLWASTAELTIVQAQDLLGLGSESRMNTPSTLGGNWSWRACPGAFDSALAEKLKHYTKLYGRTI
ncbi:4-alpha-glucanotransferase [Frisingicoccus sp.]|uniref:4-alpha-glucanotransferase n=1 Tax=Frisingicoccus sp. TaxID=1918627 RepID=UPI003AB5029F